MTLQPGRTKGARSAYRSTSPKSALFLCCLVSGGGVEDIIGMPWIEINFTADIEHNNAEVMPRILTAEGSCRGAMTSKRDVNRGVAQRPWSASKPNRPPR